MSRDLVDMMQDAARRLEAETIKAERLELLQRLERLEGQVQATRSSPVPDQAAELERLRQALVDADVTRANVLALLRDLTPRNGADAERLAVHKRILSRPFFRRSAR